MPSNQGNLANSSGNTLEKAVMATLQSKGFEVVYYRAWNKKREMYGTELLLRNAPFTSIYKHAANTEFLLKSEIYNLEIRIECKWQQSAGSVDEKFPYLYLNCIESMPEKDIIVIVDGGGAKAGAVTWLRNAAREKRYQGEVSQTDVQVMNVSEFMVWANDTFR